MLILPIPFDKLVEGREAAITANQRDMTAFNEIQAGQIQNALDMELFTPRVNTAFNQMDAGTIANASAANDLAGSDMDLILRTLRQPSLERQQADRMDAYDLFGRNIVLNTAGTQNRNAENEFNQSVWNSNFMSDPQSQIAYLEALLAQLRQRAQPAMGTMPYSGSNIPVGSLPVQ